MNRPDLTIPVADAVKRHWVDRHLPVMLRPYARLARWERPIGWWLLLWPCWWSAALAAHAAGAAYPDPWHMMLFLAGAIAMRGAGCTWNDILDRDLDGKVERTKLRPIPSGQVTTRQAALFMVAQALVGFLVLIQFNGFSIVLGISSLGIVAIYPLMKRFIDWPQAVLGLAFSWGALMGWAAVFGRLDLAPVFIYAAAVLWTIGYDTIYAHQDKDDDAIVGVRSTARLFANDTHRWVGFFYALTVIAWVGALYWIDAGAIAYLGVIGFAAHLVWQVATLRIDDADRCLMQFRANREAGALPFLGLIIEMALRAV